MIWVLSGEKGSGKSRSLMRLCHQNPGAFTGVITLVKNGERYFYLPDKERWIALESPDGNGLRVGRFVFRKEAFEEVFSLFMSQEKNNRKTFVLDEIGPLELRGEGFAALLKFLLNQTGDLNLLLVVRKFFQREILEKFGIRDYRKITIDELSEIPFRSIQ